jgi:micrococcal nuclease
MENFSHIFSTFLISVFLFVYEIEPNVLSPTDFGIKEGTVVNVVDGDTIDVFTENKIQRVRLLGVNTPETVDKRKGVECYGMEASNFLKETLKGKIVDLKIDDSQGEKDKYQRLLRYVYLDDSNINLKIIEEGYGFEATYGKPYQFQKEFRQAQTNARDKNNGLWSEENCEY